MMNFDMEKQVFCANKNVHKKLCTDNYLMNSKTMVKEIENGLVLPVKENAIYHTNPAVLGGICDSSGNFIDGHMVHYETPNVNIWLRCTQGYEVNEKIINRNETVIYGGFLNPHFGHFISESISRLYYFFQNPKIKYKIIFLRFDVIDEIPFCNILEAIGLKKEQYELITEVTQFSRIIIPEQSIYMASGYRKEYKILYDNILTKVKPGSHKKIYLSKSSFMGEDLINGDYFENFYKSRGFEIIYPETLPFTEQVSILFGADEVVALCGTLCHLLLFCKDNIKSTILTRRSDKITNQPIVIGTQIKNIETYYVDVTYNYLPKFGDGGVLFMGPTKYWIEYLDSQKISYKPEDVDFDIHVKPFVYDYLIRWAIYNKSIKKFKDIRNYPLSDVINLINQTFLDETVDTKKFPERDDVAKMQNQIKELTATIEKQKIQIEEQKQSVHLKENITQFVPQIEISQAHKILARGTEDKFNIVRKIVTKIEDDLKSSDKIFEEKCEILKDQVKKQDEKINLLEKRLIKFEESNKLRG